MVLPHIMSCHPNFSDPDPPTYTNYTAYNLCHVCMYVCMPRDFNVPTSLPPSPSNPPSLIPQIKKPIEEGKKKTCTCTNPHVFPLHTSHIHLTYIYTYIHTNPQTQTPTPKPNQPPRKLIPFPRKMDGISNKFTDPPPSPPSQNMALSFYFFQIYIYLFSPGWVPYP